MSHEGVPIPRKLSTSCGTREVSCHPSISSPRVNEYLTKWLMTQLKFCQSKINFNKNWDIQCTGIDKMSSSPTLPQHSISNLINFNKWPALHFVLIWLNLYFIYQEFGYLTIAPLGILLSRPSELYTWIPSLAV